MTPRRRAAVSTAARRRTSGSSGRRAIRSRTRRPGGAAPSAAPSVVACQPAFSDWPEHEPERFVGAVDVDTNPRAAVVHDVDVRRRRRARPVGDATVRNANRPYRRRRTRARAGRVARPCRCPARPTPGDDPRPTSASVCASGSAGSHGSTIERRHRYRVLGGSDDSHGHRVAVDAEQVVAAHAAERRRAAVLAAQGCRAPRCRRVRARGRSRSS